MLFFVLYLLAAVCFGLSVANVHSRVNFIALGLLLWVLVPLLRSATEL